ncbi:hypothetical protein CALCODRAFT_479008 [Calocera cornea HHB12733]|uniref:DUF6818 domain-containing protein n=1 Tax=Calocera cornea HHB12733 TaxID=1353952 RepID=A0A165K5R4_9BASI|nr:hypothetical protein CALCODRAFT_479008 [Calocera cornea HHB12733]
MPGHASAWGSGSAYSGSPGGMPHSPQIDSDGLPHTFADAVSYALTPDPLPSLAQDAQPAPPSKKRKGTKATTEGAREPKKMKGRKLNRPIGPGGWEDVMAGMQSYWATEGMEGRSAESLKRKFAELSHKPKPTGEGEMPDLIRRAKDIDREIQNDVHMGNLQDDDEPEDAEEEPIDWPPSDREDAPRAQRAAQPGRASNTPSTTTTDERVLLKQRRHVTPGPKASGRHLQTSTLLANVSRAFDPETQAERLQQRDSMRAERSLFQSEISSLQAQLRDKQYELVTVSLEKDKLIESLRTQLLQDARAHLVVQGELDVAKAKLEMQERMRTMLLGMGGMGKLMAQSMSLSPADEAQSSSTTM